MKSKLVAGGGDMLDLATRAWSAATGDPVIGVEISQGVDYAFNTSPLDAYDPATTLLFAAFDERFGNFKRADLMREALARGFQLASITAPGGVVAPDAKVGPNVFIGSGAIVGAGSVVEFNSVVHAGAVIDYGARVKASCWIDSGVTIGRRAEIGAHCILRMGVAVASNVKIGRLCDIGVPGLYRTDVASKTVYDPRYDEPLVVYGG
ncbi:MAG: UDP-3-O-(3-hydroxymyristoyl)glucosamine N-acyltransferase [Gemmatimonas sp.]|nr:UDP-3-O-(3-hydroxymyristoyl)glucosamine N-acyltransferase [Gemmatimonas sp.]